MIKIQSEVPPGEISRETIGHIDDEIARFETWLTSEKRASPLATPERGAVRMYLIFLIQKGPHAGIENPV